MKRKVSQEFKNARREMLANRTKCQECENYATELHHIIAVKDGGTDAIDNLMPLCEKCHKEYTSEQIVEQNKLWVELNISDDGDVTARCSEDKEVEQLGNIRSAEFNSITTVNNEEIKKTSGPVHYEYQWIVTVEIPAQSERESKEKLNKFKSELLGRYAVTDDVWLTGIRRYNGNK